MKIMIKGNTNPNWCFTQTHTHTYTYIHVMFTDIKKWTL